jgi:YidC/Oxa1 family membrane protein insertase
MFDLLARTLAFFYDVWPSYGMAIVLFTIAIYLVLTPLTIKSTRSMIAMQRVQPELKKLQDKHKGDKEALQREMMAFYQANNINPFSSCLPLLLQMPIFFILFRVLNQLTKVGEDGTFNPSYISKDSALYRALDPAREMVSWGMDLSHSASKQLSDEGLLVALPFLVLVGLVVLTSWFQQRQVAGRNPNAQANPQQQMITKIMPFIFIPISFSMPAGVVIYFVTSNCVRIAQQAVVTRLEFPDKGKGGEDKAKPKKPAPSSPVIDVEPKTPARTGGQPNRNTSKKKKRR